jgi:hypothetical protein
MTGPQSLFGRGRGENSKGNQTVIRRSSEYDYRALSLLLLCFVEGNLFYVHAHINKTDYVHKFSLIHLGCSFIYS